MADSLITFPELILLDIVKKGLVYLRKDYAAQTDKTKSYIHTVLTNNNYDLQRYASIEQAKKVFSLDDTDVNGVIDDPRYLDVDMMYNMKVEPVPALYISLPTEGMQSGGNGIGLDAGYQDDIFEDSTYDGGGHLVTQGTFTPVYTRRFQSTYSIVITSDNSNEVVLIYHVMKNLMISLLPQMALAGLQNIQVGGNDVQLKSDLVPKSMYIRQISLNLQYETSAPNIFGDPLFKDIFAKGTPVNE